MLGPNNLPRNEEHEHQPASTVTQGGGSRVRFRLDRQTAAGQGASNAAQEVVMPDDCFLLAALVSGHGLSQLVVVRSVGSGV
jgi:hypothetical protein